ncbi:MAG: 50S ribosomal protein L29 [Deltaproteobacteria bacterium]|nr:50S ribosomal protein L29 [Deltaproteobacteria bacterium]
MRAKEIRGRDLEELLKLEKSLRDELFTYKFQNFTNRLDNTSQIQKTRRDLARVLTVIRQKRTAS